MATASQRSAAGPAAGEREQRAVPDDLRVYLMAGFATMVLLLGGLGGWAATVDLAGAVIGNGLVVVDSNVKKVQHPTGGVVGEIRVRDGFRVEEGDLLIRLDETVTRANLGIVTSQLDELAARQARLVAERDGQDWIAFPKSLLDRKGTREVEELMTGERQLFTSRRGSRNGQKSQLSERLNQLNEEITGLEAQRKAKADEYDLIQQELKEIEKLWAKNLAPLSKRIALHREATRIDGERAQVIASTAQSKAKIAETELQILQLDTDLRTEVSKELREIQGKQAEFNERRIAAEDQLRRIEIRAPQTGIVHQLAVHTVGGVITAGDPIMLIVPFDESMVLEAKISPQDISQVRPGQLTYVRLTSFNQRTTPELKGTVSRISADLTRDQANNTAYYVVRVALSDEELSKLGEQRLIPGMPAEIHIQTGARTAISYITKPLWDQVARAFKER